MDKGADPNIRDNFGETALMWAEEGGHNDTARLIRDHIHLQRARQNLAFAKYFMDYDFDQDVASRIFDIEHDYDPGINIRMLDEERRDRLTKSLQRLASVRGLHDRDSVFRHLKEPELMQDVSEHLSRIAPIPSVHQRLMLDDRQTGRGIGFSKRRKRKNYTRKRY